MKTLVRNYETFPSLINEFFNAGNGNTPWPLANIKTSENDFLIQLSAPGFKKEDFKIEIHENTLTIATDVVSDVEETYARKEFQISSFSRSFKLPRTVNTDAISASYENGILSLKLPKLEEAKSKEPRLIEIC